MVLILVSMDRGVHTYTLAANMGVSGVLYRKSREGFGGRATKNTSGGRGLLVTIKMLTHKIQSKVILQGAKVGNVTHTQYSTNVENTGEV